MVRSDSDIHWDRDGRESGEGMNRCQSTQKSILLYATASILVALSVSCRPVGDPATAEKSRLADAWIRLTSLDSVAESLLEATPFIALTEKQAFELAGEFSFPAATKAKPFLIRAVGPHSGTAGAFEIHTRENGDVSVRGVALGDHDVSIERRPVVAWLDQPPHELYVSFSVAK
jgi:hypothetical protein